MKVAIALLALVAVANAAFSGSLVQQTQPALDKAMFVMRLAAGNKAAEIRVIDQILAHVQAAAESLLQQANQIIAQGAELSESLQAALQNALTGLTAVAQGLQGSVQQVIQQLINEVSQTLNLNKDSPLDAVIHAVQQAAAQAVATAQQLASQLIHSIDIHALITQAVQAVLPPNVAQLVIAQLGLNNRGVIGDLFGNLWGQLTGAAGSIANQIGQIVSQIQTVGAQAVESLQTQALDFVSAVQQGAHTISSQAAAELLSNIHLLQHQLGSTYQQVVDALNQIQINA